MLRFLFPVLCALSINHILCAQAPHFSHAIRFDAAALWQNGVQVSYTYQADAKSGFELQFLHRQHLRNEEDVFNGDRFVEYAKYRIDSFVGWSHKYLNNPQWQYLGENRPMESLPQILAASTGMFKLGYNIYYPTQGGRWQFMLQPGLQAGRCQYYTIEDRTRIIYQEQESQEVSGGIIRTLRRVYYQQTQSMRLQTAWFLGLSYTAGVSRRFGTRFFLECRAGVNLTLNPPYEAGVPAPASRLFGHYALNIGYMLGRLRMKCDPPISSG